MYRTLTLALAMIGCTAFPLFAQDVAALQSAKVRLMRQAINFYSNDTVLSAAPVNCDAADMKSLRDCARKLPKVEAKIDKWDKMPLTTTEDLRALARTIKGDVIANREYRKTYAQYPEFIKNVNGIVAAVPAAPHTDSVPSQTAAPSSSVLPADTAVAQNPLPAQVSAMTVTDTVAQEAKPASSASMLPEGVNLWNIAAIVLSLLALIKSFIPQKQREAYREEPQFVAPPPPPVRNNSDDMTAKLSAVIEEVEELNRMVLEIDARVQRRLDDMKHGNTGA